MNLVYRKGKNTFLFEIEKNIAVFLFINLIPRKENREMRVAS